MIADDIIMKTEAEKVNCDEEDDKRVHNKYKFKYLALNCLVLDAIFLLYFVLLTIKM